MVAIQEPIPWLHLQDGIFVVHHYHRVSAACRTAQTRIVTTRLAMESTVPRMQLMVLPNTFTVQEERSLVAQRGLYWDLYWIWIRRLNYRQAVQIQCIWMPQPEMYVIGSSLSTQFYFKIIILTQSDSCQACLSMSLSISLHLMYRYMLCREIIGLPLRMYQ
jgi:hypothetical protein